MISIRARHRRRRAEKDQPQFCGVLEFSGKPGLCYLPSWMMQNLRLANKGKASFTSAAVPVQQGQYCKLQPHQQSFFDVLQEMGMCLGAS